MHQGRPADEDRGDWPRLSNRGDSMTTATLSLRHTVFAFGAALALCLATSASAEGPPDTDDFNRTGFYVGAGGSYAWADVINPIVEDHLKGSNVSAVIENAPGFNVRAGGRFWKALALELQYEWLDDYDINLRYSGLTGKINVDQQTLTANLKIYPIPLWRIQPYILAGVGFQVIDIDSSFGGGVASIHDDAVVLAARAGLGFDFHITRNLTIFTEAGATYADYNIDLPSSVGSDIPLALYLSTQAGVMWRF
jgi:opacity protein-like surface antigen